MEKAVIGGSVAKWTVAWGDNSVFGNCLALTEVTVRPGVTHLPINAFRDCSHLTTVTLPEGLISIDDGAFENCRSLHTVKMELGITKIGARAFDNTPALCEVFVPHSLKKLGRGAFGTKKRKDGEKITVCVENEYMVRRMKRLLFWSGSANCTTVKLVGKSIEERKRERRRANLDEKGTHLIG